MEFKGFSWFISIIVQIYQFTVLLGSFIRPYQLKLDKDLKFLIMYYDFKTVQRLITT